jgi:hypothetical protein
VDICFPQCIAHECETKGITIDTCPDEQGDKENLSYSLDMWESLPIADSCPFVLFALWPLVLHVDACFFV